MLMASVGERVTLPAQWPVQLGVKVTKGPGPGPAGLAIAFRCLESAHDPMPGCRGSSRAGGAHTTWRDGLCRQTYGPAPVSGVASRGSPSGAGDGWVTGEATEAPVAGSGTGWATPRSSRTHLTGRR